MSGGGALNLSLLSRGIGEVQKNGHEKVEVFLEPSDYFNFAADRPYYLPPIQSTYHPHYAESSPRFSTTRSARDGCEIPLPKTFTTRKGALLLFSEDMALKTNEKEKKRTRHHRHPPFHSSLSSAAGDLDDDEAAIVLKTVDDLAKSILHYGAARHGYEDDDDKMYLKFIHRRREQWERQIRPGYSAKRYLSTWTKNWDDQVFESVVSKGYLTERSLFHYNLFLPHLRRHLFHEDLSNMPQPYRLMKNMLLTPGSLSGYTFFRELDIGPLIEEDEEGADGQRIRRPDTKRSIRVIRTNKEGEQKEISYSALDKDTQKEVITDLLVKSAVHYALSKQEEILEESLAQALQSEHEDGSETTYQLSVSKAKTADNKSVPTFDMRDAVDSLLDKQKGGPYVLGGELPDVDAHSHSSEHTGSFKGGSVPQHAVKAMGARHTPRGSWPTSEESAAKGGSGGKDKEFRGDLPVAAVRDMSASSSHSSVPQLPAIGRHALSPIKDVSRETSQLVTLPPIHRDGRVDEDEGDMPEVHVMPPTPQQSHLTGQPTPRSDGMRSNLHKVAEGADSAGTEAGGPQISGESSPTDSAAALTQRAGQKSRTKRPKEDTSKGKTTGILFQPPERTSHLHSHNAFTFMPHHSHGWDYGRLVEGHGHRTEGHGHRTGRSLAAGSGESKSMKGSMVMAPDGEIINVGGSVGPSQPHDVGMINDVTPQLRPLDVNMTDESGVSDEEPDEWRATSKMRKPRALSSKLSDSLKRSVGKREIDYTSGDIDATMSMHSWSYAPKGEEGENGLVKAGSMRSLAGLSNDGGQKESDSTAEHTHDEGNPSEEEDEKWARITERPEEEEDPTVSREPTLEAIPQEGSPQQNKDPTPAGYQSSSHPSPPEDETITADGGAGSQESHHSSGHLLSPGDDGTAQASKHTTPGPASKHTTPGPASKHSTPGSASKHTTPGPGSKHTTPGLTPRQPDPAQSKHTTPGASLTPGNMLGAEPVPSANGPRPTPASVTHSEEDAAEDEQAEVETARSRSIALQTDSSTPEGQTPRVHSSSTSRRESGKESGEEDDEGGEEQWPSGKDTTLDAVPEESPKGSAAPSRMTSSGVDKHASSELPRSETADERGKPGSKAESSKSESKSESRQGSSKAAKSRAASSKRAASRTGSSAADQLHGEHETSMIKEETNINESGAPSTAPEIQEERQGASTARTLEGENDDIEDAGHVSKGSVISRSEKASNKTGPSPHAESKASQGPSKAGSRAPSSQISRHSNEPEVRSSSKTSAKADTVVSGGQASAQLKPRSSAKENAGSRSTSSKLSHHSQAKSGSRSVNTRLSQARMTTPSPGVGEEGSHLWDEDGPEHGELEVPLEDHRPPSTPSSATEGTIRVSGEESANPGLALSVEGTQLLTPPGSPPAGHRTRMTLQESVAEDPAETETLTIASRRSSVTEQDILDTLTEHAKRIADSVLSHNQAGQDLEQDVRNAADMWMAAHPTRDISRSHSVQDTLHPGAVEQIMDAQRRASSAGPTTDEYKDLIRQSLTTAVAKAAGLSPEEIPEDTEISPDLLEALASQKLSPDDIAILRDEETGRPVIKSRQELAQALGGVAEGHIYMAPNGKGGSHAGSEVGIKRQMSIPADRASLVDNMDYDVISYGGTEIMSERGRPAGRSKAGSKPGSIAGATVADLKDYPAEPTKASGGSSPDAENDEFNQRLQQLEKEKEEGDGKSASLKGSIMEEGQTPVLPGDGSPKMEQDRQSEKSAKTGVSQKTEQSDDSKKKKAKSPEEPFVVGLVDHKAELSKLYGAQGPGSLPSAQLETKSPVKGKKAKKDDKKEKAKKKGKGKKKGKKEEEATPEATEEPPAPAPEPVVEPEPKEPPPVPTPREPEPPKPMTASSSDRQFMSSPELTRTDDEMEFNIVREESSPEPDPPQRLNLPPPFPEEDEEDEEEEEELANDNADGLKSISNREARAAKRAAAATKRKEEVEKRRREREEQLKREKEEMERQEQLKKEMETERKRREEERRLRKQQEAEEAMKEEKAIEEAERRKRLAEERERRAKEEYLRKLEEMRRKQIEEEAKRMELVLQKQREEEARRAEEELMMSQMAEQERLEYAKKRKAEEAERKRIEEEERLKREEEARKAMEEARRLAEEMARKQAELEARLKFNRALQVEASGLDQSHDINRAFVFSYFELLQWLGLDIPEFELAKMGQQL